MVTSFRNVLYGIVTGVHYGSFADNANINKACFHGAKLATIYCSFISRTQQLLCSQNQQLDRKEEPLTVLGPATIIISKQMRECTE